MGPANEQAHPGPMFPAASRPLPWSDSKASHRRFWIARNAYLGLIAALYAPCLALVALFVALDPYDLFPWGPSPHLVRPFYNPNATPWLANVVTNSSYDTFYIGASTSAAVAASDMEQLLPGTKRAFNLSILGASMKDLEVMMDLVAKAPNVKRVIVQLEQTFVSYAGQAEDPRFVHIPAGIYENDIAKKLRLVDGRGIALAWKILTKQEYFVPEWDVRGPAQFLDWAIAHYRTPAYVAYLPHFLDENRSRLDGPRTTTCAMFPALATLPEVASKLEARGAELDVVLPAYSRVMWYEWVAPTSDLRWNKGPEPATKVETPLGFLMTLRRCATEMLSKSKNTKVFAFDREDTIVANYANYADPAHILKADVYRSMLKAIAADQDRVTVGNFAAYEQDLHDRILNYKFEFVEPK
jgi:hypothetical protein